MPDPYADAVAMGLRDALLCGMVAVEPATGDWRDDWHPRSRRAAFIGVVEEFGVVEEYGVVGEHDAGSAALLVLFRVGPEWDVVYGWRASLWPDAGARAELVAAYPDPVDLVGSLALDLMEGIDGGAWEFPEPEATHAVWRPSSPRSVTWVRVPA